MHASDDDDDHEGEPMACEPRAIYFPPKAKKLKAAFLAHTLLRIGTRRGGSSSSNSCSSSSNASWAGVGERWGGGGGEWAKRGEGGVWGWAKRNNIHKSHVYRNAD